MSDRRLSRHPDRSIEDKFDRVVAERDDLAGALMETERELDNARTAADQLLRMERQHSGSGRDGHLSETDLRPLLHALGIDTVEQP